MSISPVQSGSITIAFPDVCKTPATVVATPIPYPPTATKARKLQQSRGSSSPMAGPRAPGSGAIRSAIQGGMSGPGAGPRKPVGRRGEPDASVQAEAAQLKSRLGVLHHKLASLASEDPDEWQRLLQDYAVTASALYVTLNG